MSWSERDGVDGGAGDEGNQLPRGQVGPRPEREPDQPRPAPRPAPPAHRGVRETQPDLPQGSRHDDVWRREEHRDRGDHREQREDEEAEAVDDHGGELPVVRDLLRLVRLPELVRDVMQFFEDKCQFSMRAQTASPRRCGRGVME